MMGFLVVRNDEKSVVAVISENREQALVMAYNADGIDEVSKVYELISEPRNSPYSAKKLNMRLKKNQKLVSLAQQKDEISKRINDNKDEIERMEEDML